MSDPALVERLAETVDKYARADVQAAIADLNERVGRWFTAYCPRVPLVDRPALVREMAHDLCIGGPMDKVAVPAVLLDLYRAAIIGRAIKRAEGQP